MIPTVKIVVEKTEENPLGYVIINEDDLDDSMTLFEPEDSEGATPRQPRTRKKQAEA